MSESALHKAVIQYIRLQYPWARVKTDYSGIYLGRGNKAMKANISALSSHPGFPDIIIYELMTDNIDTYCGLAMELKATTPYKVNKQLKTGTHLSEQSEWLNHLSSLGFMARFVTGLDEALTLIDYYLTNKPTNT